MKNSAATFDKDYPNRKITVANRFNAPLSVVWDAFTNPKTLEKWFAPKPFQAITKSMDFREGGQWLYYMLSPKGEKFWSISVYKKIQPNKSFEASDAFCNEKGEIDTNLPRLVWRYDFWEEVGGVKVNTVITFASEEDMKKILEMGFEEGYKMALSQLQELFK